MTNIYKGILHLSFEDIKRLHSLPEDTIIIPKEVHDGIELHIGSTEHKSFMAEGSVDFNHLRRSKLLYILGKDKEEKNEVNVTFNITGTVPSIKNEIEEISKKITEAFKKNQGLK